MGEMKNHLDEVTSRMALLEREKEKLDLELKKEKKEEEAKACRIDLNT